MRRALPFLLVAATAHADPDPCTAAAMHLAKVTEVAPVIVGATCHIRMTREGEIDVDRLQKVFPKLDHSAEQTLPITSAKQLAAVVVCDGPMPSIDFKKNRAWVVVRDHLRSGSTEIVRGFDDGHTLLLADRTREGCTGGAVYTFARFLTTTIVVAPADRTVERRVCEVPQPPCPQNAK
jgi:hypothetical protein